MAATKARIAVLKLKYFIANEEAGAAETALQNEAQRNGWLAANNLSSPIIDAFLTRINQEIDFVAQTHRYLFACCIQLAI